MPQIELSVNKFEDRNDYLGLIQFEPEPQQFFNIEKLTYGLETRARKYFKTDQTNYPTMFVLSDIEKTYEREVYSFMAALGDFGGFNDGVILIPAILMSIYSRKMFLQELFGQLRMKSESNPASREKMLKKCSLNQTSFELAQSDCELLADESERVKRVKNSWFISLCFSQCICKRERGMQLQKVAIERFEKQLDIRSIVKTRVDLSILLSLLLSKEQLLLFRNQHARAFVDHDKLNLEGEKAAQSKDIIAQIMDHDTSQQPKKSLRAAFEDIKGYHVQTDLDRKLILGFWKNKEENQAM